MRSSVLVARAFVLVVVLAVFGVAIPSGAEAAALPRVSGVARAGQDWKQRQAERPLAVRAWCALPDPRCQQAGTAESRPAQERPSRVGKLHPLGSSTAQDLRASAGCQGRSSRGVVVGGDDVDPTSARPCGDLAGRVGGISRQVFAHYMPSLPISIDNAPSTTTTTRPSISNQRRERRPRQRRRVSA